ncbi:hypothetical protein Tco_1406000 [Tanacetum coccineum]
MRYIQAICINSAELALTSYLEWEHVKQNFLRRLNRHSRISLPSLSVAGNSKGDDGAGTGCGGEEIWGSRDNSRDNRDGGGDDEGCANNQPPQ